MTRSVRDVPPREPSGDELPETDEPVQIPPGGNVSSGRTARALASINVLQRVVMLANFLLLPRVLPIGEIGALATSLAISTIFGVLGDMGIQVATVRLLSRAIEQRRPAGAVIGASLLTRTVLGIFAAVLGTIFLFVIPFASEIRTMGLIALAALLNPFTSVYTAVLQSFYATRRLAAYTLASAIVTTGATLAVAYATRSATAATAALFGSLTLFGPVGALLARSYATAELTNFRALARDLLRTAWRLGLGAFIYSAYNRLDTLVLSVSVAAAQVAVYYAAYRFAETIYIVTVLVIMAVFPVLSRLFYRERSSAVVFARSTLRHLASLCLVIATVGPLISTPLMLGLYGERYRAAGILMALLLLGTPFTALAYAIGQAGVAFGNPRLVVRSAIAGLIVTAVGATLLIPEFGNTGAAVATVATNIAAFLVVLPWAIRELELDTRAVLGRGVAGLVIAGACVFGGAALPVAASLAAAAAVAPAAPIIVGALTVEDLRKIRLRLRA